MLRNIRHPPTDFRVAEVAPRAFETMQPDLFCDPAQGNEESVERRPRNERSERHFVSADGLSTPGLDEAKGALDGALSKSLQRRPGDRLLRIEADTDHLKRRCLDSLDQVMFGAVDGAGKPMKIVHQQTPALSAHGRAVQTIQGQRKDLSRHEQHDTLITGPRCVCVGSPGIGYKGLAGSRAEIAEAGPAPGAASKVGLDEDTVVLTGSELGRGAIVSQRPEVSQREP